MPETAAWDEHRGDWQAITNAHPIPPRARQHDLDPYIPIHARLVWARDGEETRETFAVAWAGRSVLVNVPDRRLRVPWVWVDASDVQRL